MTVDELPEIGVGMLGYAFMGKAHSNAFRKLAYVTWPPPLRPRLVAIAGRNDEAVAAAARRYGFDRWTTRWEEVVADPEIGLFDNLGPNDVHAAPTIAAAKAGKHVVRQILFRRYLEHWIFEGPLRLWVTLDCAKGEDPTIRAVTPALRDAP